MPNGAPEISKVEAIASRVLNTHHYESVEDVFKLGALYLIAISRAHIFLDGNKRTAFQSAMLFLAINGVDIVATSQLEEITVEAAQGLLTVDRLAEIFRELQEK